MERDVVERKILMLLDRLDELTEYITEETIFFGTGMFERNRNRNGRTEKHFIGGRKK